MKVYDIYKLAAELRDYRVRNDRKETDESERRAGGLRRRKKMRKREWEGGEGVKNREEKKHAKPDQ